MENNGQVVMGKSRLIVGYSQTVDVAESISNILEQMPRHNQGHNHNGDYVPGYDTVIVIMTFLSVITSIMEWRL